MFASLCSDVHLGATSTSARASHVEFWLRDKLSSISADHPFSPKCEVGAPMLVQSRAFRGAFPFQMISAPRSAFPTKTDCHRLSRSMCEPSVVDTNARCTSAIPP